MLRKDVAFIRIQRVRTGQEKPRKTLKLGISSFQAWEVMEFNC